MMVRVSRSGPWISLPAGRRQRELTNVVIRNGRSSQIVINRETLKAILAEIVPDLEMRDGNVVLMDADPEAENAGR